MPELAHVYGLTPDQIWDMSQRQYSRFLEHHDRMVKELKDGSRSS